MQRHLVNRILCVKPPDGHLKFECSLLHSNVVFYFKFDEYLKCDFLFLQPYCKHLKTKVGADQNTALMYSMYSKQ